MTAPQDPAAFESLVQKYMQQMGADQARTDSLSYAPPPQFRAPRQAQQQEQPGASDAALGLQIGMKLAGGSAAAPATPTILGASAVPGASIAPATPTVLSASATPSVGAAAAPSYMAAAAPAALALMAAATGKQTYDAYKQGSGRGAMSGAIAGWKDSPAWMKYNMVLAPAALAGGALGGIFGHKSTKDFQKERWGKIANSADAPTAAYGKQYLDYLGSDQAKTDALAPNTFDAKKAAGTLSAKDVWGSTGMFDTFKGDWLGKYSEDQRSKISQALIDNSLLKSDHGDTLVTDAAKAKTLADAILAAPATQAVSTRSTTRSPGIGKDGKPVYSARR